MPAVALIAFAGPHVLIIFLRDQLAAARNGLLGLQAVLRQTLVRAVGGCAALLGIALLAWASRSKR